MLLLLRVASCRVASLVLSLSCSVLSCPCFCPCFVLSASCCLSVALRCAFVVLGGFVDSFLVVWGRLGGRCWPFWVVLGGSWDHFGVCFGHLGRSWAVLGSSCARETVQLSDAPFWCATCVDFWTVLGAQEAAQTTPRRHPETPRWPKKRQDAAQDEQNSMINFDLKTTPFRIRLKTVLGRSWDDLGPVLGSIFAKKHWET